jgi:hypothetical protein
LQALDLQPQAPIQPLQKKSCLKHYRRFFVCSGMCHHRRVNERKFNPPPSGHDAAIVAEPPRLCSDQLQSAFAGITADNSAGWPLSSLLSFTSFAKPSAFARPPAFQSLPVQASTSQYK